MRERQPSIFDSLEQGSRARDLMMERARAAWPVTEPSLVFLPPRRSSLLTRLPRPVRVASVILSVATGLTSAACAPTPAPKPSPEVQPPGSSPVLAATSESTFGYPFSGLWYLNAGPHSDGLTKGMRAALDFGSPEVIDCPGGKPLENRFAEASAAGKVAIVGNERDATDPNHSTVEIDHGQGLSTGYTHLAKISVNVGQEVKQGQRLGNPSCEIPPGGATSGIHLHWYIKKDGKFVPADGIKFPQGQIKAGLSNKDGTLIGPNNFVRTANEKRCGPDESSINACGGIRNDLDTGTVLGIAAKPQAPPAPAPTREVPKPAVTPTPAEVKPAPGFSTHRSIILPYQIDYPSNWQVITSPNPNNKFEFYIPVPSTKNSVRVLGEKINPWVTSEDYKDNLIKQLQVVGAKNIAFPTPISVAGKSGWATGYYSQYGSSMMIVFTDKGWGWQISLIAEQSFFTDEAIPIFNQMVASMTLR